ncbi:MAG: RNA polymerase sigma factor [Ignavibacteriae bacterium]|nr:RNA polymerase sigma factor [Ignavibacteriota bacterium]
MPVADAQHVIQKAQEGSHDAFRILVERHMKQAYNLAYGFLLDHDDAEDVAQESFVRAYQSLGSFRVESEFGTWLYRIVHNVALNRLRHEKTKSSRHVSLDHPLADSASGDGNVAEGKEQQMHVERALHELPTLQRSVVILRHLEGLSTRQVSQILGCTEGTVKTHLHRGLKKMKKLLSFIHKDMP